MFSVVLGSISTIMVAFSPAVEMTLIILISGEICLTSNVLLVLFPLYLSSPE